ncbi:MAG: cell division protein FtsA [Candidatus Omnitrophica bacterium]|nr:cell division protein FtsA [Candidatus Omnitrophota bacterium]
MEQIYLVYIGTTKVVGIRGVLDKSESVLMETLVKVPSLGFDKGIVVDVEKACAQVKEVVSKIAKEDMLHKIPLCVILSNNLVKTFDCTSSIYFGDSAKMVTQLDIDRVIDQTRGTATIPLEEFIIMAKPQGFTINDLEGVKNPLDLEARRLAVNLVLYTVNTDVLRNLNKVFDRLEINVSAYYPRIVTSAFSVLRDEEKRDGVVLIDIGGYTTSISYYINNTLDFYEVIPMGGETITNYLSNNLHISVLEARRLKEQYGSAVLLERFEDEIIPVVDIFGKTKLNINKKRLYDQIHIAAKELVDKIYVLLRSKRQQNRQICGAVVTGGGANLDGFLDLIQKTLNISVRLGITRNVSGHADAVSNSGYAAQLGLLEYLLSERNEKQLHYVGKNVLTKKILQVREWIQENF